MNNADSALGDLSTLRIRLILTAILAVIFLQATPSQPLPLYWDHGSAFSAATADVALPIRRDVAQEAHEPGKTSASFKVASLPIYEFPPVAGFVWPATQQTGPPTRPPRSPNLSPRAPPTWS